ncbi:hypothetical protein CYME_CMM142C [Cyanidioschyzon merolae strain 10D]|uniref:Uncharacterized protein n=1 Tax=Cyanidioschyzon merolae (strain NIES-3377 / 10D) TaxID=280699 RepID=M1VDT3_CYAM1|nr:hypothetical protein CYME_CMM142C [Cyanidioschyzon merolae strain 10D]BAM81002.1 hypothetical protein CYME_CMM142C [Cyanidioschyzon merolae strain 10D]|eukprot:XP_005537038.1 hypothetical protein CYME_CMM142C [Cyanidioschyzon merolae strain 10D]
MRPGAWRNVVHRRNTATAGIGNGELCCVQVILSGVSRWMKHPSRSLYSEPCVTREKFSDSIYKTGSFSSRSTLYALWDRRSKNPEGKKFLCRCELR